MKSLPSSLLLILLLFLVVGAHAQTMDEWRLENGYGRGIAAFDSGICATGEGGHELCLIFEWDRHGYLTLHAQFTLSPDSDRRLDYSKLPVFIFDSQKKDMFNRLLRDDRFMGVDDYPHDIRSRWVRWRIQVAPYNDYPRSETSHFAELQDSRRLELEIPYRTRRPETVRFPMDSLQTLLLHRYRQARARAPDHARFEQDPEAWERVRRQRELLIQELLKQFGEGKKEDGGQD